MEKLLLLNNSGEDVPLLDIDGITINKTIAYQVNKFHSLDLIGRSTSLRAAISDGFLDVSDGVTDFTVDRAFEILDSFITAPKDSSGKPRVHQTSRPLGTTTTWMGVGDDPLNVNDVGGGADFNYHHVVSGTLNESIYIDFNCHNNITYLHEGYVVWHECQMDRISLAVVPDVVTGTVSSGTYYNLYGGYLVVPAAGDGTFQLTSDITQPHGGLVFMPHRDDGSAQQAFWNADWNAATGLYENISAAPYGNGQYNMFAVEVELAKFVHRITLIGNGFELFKSSDSHMIGSGMKLKMRCETCEDCVGDHNWKVGCILTMHREKTV